MKFKPPSDKRIVLYRSFIDVGPAVLLLLVLVCIAAPMTHWFPWSVQQVGLAGLLVPIPFFALLPIVVLAYIVHQIYNNRYVIGIDHVAVICGRLSLRTKDIRVNFEDVRGVEVDRTLYQRIFGIGDLLVGSAMKGDIEVRMEGIARADEFHQIVEERMRAHREKVFSHAGTGEVVR